jgi:hypothetical protein
MDKLFSGLFVLAGVFLGGYLTFLTQHHKLLLERQLEAFTKFFGLIEIAHNKASDILYDPATQARAERELKIGELYQPVFIQARIIRLYLHRTLRDEFYKLVNDYWSLHATTGLGDSRFNKMRQHLDRIQDIFEEELSPHSWLNHVLARRAGKRSASRL